MARITLTVEGEPEEVHQALIDFLGWGSAKRTNGPAHIDTTMAYGEDSVDAESEQPMTPYELDLIWDHIQIDARQIIQEIATRPDGYPSSDLQRRFNVDGRTIGGQLSSIGWAMNSEGISREKAHPIIRVTKKGQLLYKMRPEIAKTIRGLKLSRGYVDSPEERRATLRKALEREDLHDELRANYERSLAELEHDA